MAAWSSLSPSEGGGPCRGSSRRADPASSSDIISADRVMSIRPLVTSIAALLLTVTPIAAQNSTMSPAERALSPGERTIVQHVHAHVEQGLALLERAVNINSGTMNF